MTPLISHKIRVFSGAAAQGFECLFFIHQPLLYCKKTPWRKVMLCTGVARHSTLALSCEKVTLAMFSSHTTVQLILTDRRKTLTLCWHDPLTLTWTGTKYTAGGSVPSRALSYALEAVVSISLPPAGVFHSPQCPKTAQDCNHRKKSLFLLITQNFYDTI